MTLRDALDRLEKARKKFFEARAKRKGSKPGGKRRERWAKIQDFWEARKKKLARIVKRLRATPSLSRVSVTMSPGAPHWGGAGDVMDQFVEPFMNRRGLPNGSGKRTPAENAQVGGSPNSDHLTTKTTTDARDFPTFSGEDDARALAAALGNHSWQPNSYATVTFRCDGRVFRAQILWGSAIGHGDHVHVGVSG